MRALTYGAAATLGLVLLAWGLSAPASQSLCADYQAMADHLGTGYGETLRGQGLAGDAAVVSLFRSEDGTFSILVTGADGATCIIAAGRGWTIVVPDKADGPEA